MAYAYWGKQDADFQEMMKKKYEEILAKRRKSEEEKPKSESSIYEKITEQWNAFYKSMINSKIPLKWTDIDDKPCIYINNKSQENSFDDMYGHYLGDEDYDPKIRLILTPEEIAGGVIHYPADPQYVLLNWMIPGYNVLTDANGRCKYEPLSANRGLTYIRTNHDGQDNVIVYRINPNYRGDVRWEEYIPKKKEIWSLCFTKDKEAKKWLRGKMDINNIPRSKAKWNSGVKQIKAFAFVKVTKYDQSAALFGYSGVKKQMFESGEVYSIADILIDFKCKKDDLIRDVVEICYNNKTYKFLGEELEFVFPNLEEFTKGYQLPKDRVVRVGSVAKVTNDKDTKLTKNDTVKVIKKVFKDYFEVDKDNKKYLIRKKQLKVV